MDEKPSVSSPWQIEEIPNEEFVYRHFSVNRLQGKKPRRFPSEADLRPDPDGMSVYWDRHIDVAKIYITIGLSHNPDGSKFKNHTGFKVFKFEVGFVRSIEGVKDVLHTPQFHGDPSPVGKPNIRAHSSVVFMETSDEDQLQVAINLSDYCRNFHSLSYCDFDVRTVVEELNNLQDRLNDTPYHRS